MCISPLFMTSFHVHCLEVARVCVERTHHEISTPLSMSLHNSLYYFLFVLLVISMHQNNLCKAFQWSFRFQCTQKASKALLMKVFVHNVFHPGISFLKHFDRLILNNTISIPFPHKCWISFTHPKSILHFKAFFRQRELTFPLHLTTHQVLSMHVFLGSPQGGVNDGSGTNFGRACEDETGKIIKHVEQKCTVAKDLKDMRVVEN
jgi:hypothetical protein